MRSKLLAAAIAATALMGIGAPAAQAYPPTPRTVTATPTSGEPAYEVTVTATCTPGESITFSLPDAQAVVECVSATRNGLVSLDETLAGTASATLVAPTTPGDYRGAVSGTSATNFGSFTISVLAPDIINPSTPSVEEAVNQPTNDRNWWPILPAMSAVLVLMVYTLQRPLQLLPHR